MLRSFIYSLKQSCRQIIRNKNMSIASIFSITAMLLILGLFFILTININVMVADVKKDFDKVEIFLKDEVTVEQGQQMASEISGMDNVAKAYYQSKDQALENWKRKKWKENGYLLDGLNPNPLPNSVIINIKDIAKTEKVVEAVGKYDGIEKIKYYKEVVAGLIKLSRNIQMGAIVIISFLILVSTIVVANTIKLTVHARGKEISIMKHIGATNWFVRAPFLFEGIIIGVLSSLIAVGLVSLIYKQLLGYVENPVNIAMRTRLVSLKFMMSNLIWIFMALGVSIGACGSIASMRRFLNK